jgi:hypothetical protein
MLVKDLFELAHTLSIPDLQVIKDTLRDLDKEDVCCSICGFLTHPAALRKLEEAPVEKAMCIPCFLHNHRPDVQQEDINRISTFGKARGWWE